MIKTGQTILAADLILPLTAGEALSANDACYISTADGKAYKCDADDPTKVGFVGFAQEAASLNASVNLVHNGHFGGFAGLTINADYFLSGTAGAITSTAPAYGVKVGRAVSASVIKIESLHRTQVFVSNGTWTKPLWATFVFVEEWGAGGSGGVVFADSSVPQDGMASGGGGGEYRSMLFPAFLLGATESVTVGVGGTAVNRTTLGTTNGNAGGNTSFGSWLTANGGGGGGASVTTNGTSTAGSAGTGGGGVSYLSLKTDAGGAGGTGVGSGTATANNGGTSTYGGGGGGGAAVDGPTLGPRDSVGGNSTYGGDGGDGNCHVFGGGPGSSISASNGVAYGGGGGGCVITNNIGGSPSGTSGAGANGFCRITCI